MKSFAYNLLLFGLLALSHPAIAQTDVLHLKSDVVDLIFGHLVPDPYRWLEDVNSDAAKQWIDAQKEITATESEKYKKNMSSVKGDIQDFSAFSANDAKKTGGWYFQRMYSAFAGNTSPVLYYRQSLNEPYEVAFDPNNISKTPYSIDDWAVSDGGKYLAVALSPAGSDWREIHVRNIKKGKDLNDKIQWVRFSKIVWWNEGFFYARYEKPGTGTDQNKALGGQQLYYHKLGDKQEDDKLIVLLSSSNGVIGFQLSSNNQYLIVNRDMKIGGQWYSVITCRDLNEGLFAEEKLLVSSLNSSKVAYKALDFINGSFYFITNYGAPNKRVLRCNPDSANMLTEVIPESKKVLQSVSHINHQLVAVYFTAGQFQVYMYDYNGNALRGLTFDPGIAVSGFEGEPTDSEVVFYQRTFYLPLVIYRYNLRTHSLSPVDKTLVHYEVGKYTTDIVNYKSKDGTEVPMYLTYKKGINLKGKNPVILEGYGGYGISQEPYYKYANILFFDNNGILAVPMIRGGGELGEAWHESGSGLHKQNSFDDFIAAADFLVNEGYTSREKLAIRGASNGGLLVAAVMVQRPDLCQVVVARAGVFDMLRYNRFNGGKYWLGEYGSPQNAEEFENLLSYSPYHNLKADVSYPATLLITGLNDNRVAPLHSYKFLAALQGKSVGNNAHILYFENYGGHNGETGKKDRQEEDAFELAFIFEQMHLGLKIY